MKTNEKVKNKPKDEELLKMTEVENSKFTIVTEKNPLTDETIHYILLGRFRFNNVKYKTFKEALKVANTIDWNNIMLLVAIMIEADTDFRTRTVVDNK